MAGSYPLWAEPAVIHPVLVCLHLSILGIDDRRTSFPVVADPYFIWHVFFLFQFCSRFRYFCFLLGVRSKSQYPSSQSQAKPTSQVQRGQGLQPHSAHHHFFSLFASRYRRVCQCQWLLPSSADSRRVCLSHWYGADHDHPHQEEEALARVFVCYGW